MFDVISLEAGQVALMVGDVTGHGIRTAAIMGQLRTTTAALMALLSGVAAAHGDEAGATCLYATRRRGGAGSPAPGTHCLCCAALAA